MLFVSVCLSVSFTFVSSLLHSHLFVFSATPLQQNSQIHNSNFNFIFTSFFCQLKRYTRHSQSLSTRNEKQRRKIQRNTKLRNGNFSNLHVKYVVHHRCWGRETGGLQAALLAVQMHVLGWSAMAPKRIYAIPINHFNHYSRPLCVRLTCNRFIA